MRRILFGLCLALLCTGCNKQPSVPLVDPEYSGPRHFASYAREDFYPTLTASPTSDAVHEKVYGGIVSHHFYVEPYIARFFLAMREQKPKTVVIIGPNHFHAGGSNILTSRLPYETPWGLLGADERLIDTLVASRTLQVEEGPFSREHSISTLVGFLKYTLPQTAFVPIIIKRGTSVEELQKLEHELSSYLGDDGMVIASVDFSHHLNRFAAEFHDEKSISTIRSFDRESIDGLEVDSPESLYVLLRYLSGHDAWHSEIIPTNSAKVSHNLSSEDVTSYVFAHYTKGEVTEDSAISFLSFGDMMFDRGVRQFIESGGDPFTAIIGTEGNFFRGADFITGNLEGPITIKRPCAEKMYSFSFDPGSAQLLARHGFDAVNLGNNHALDCGIEGLRDTFVNLKEWGVDAFGGPEAHEKGLIKNVGDIRVGLYGFNALSKSDAGLKNVYQDVQALKRRAHYVVVNVHWGDEYQTQASATQQTIGRALIENGADLVIGHHPHVIQPLELYKGKPIFYSLGNFIFDQAPLATREGLAVGTVFRGSDLSLYLFPFEINNYTPQLLPSDAAATWCEKYLQDVSLDTSSEKDACILRL